MQHFLSPPIAPQWGAAGDHFIVPRTLFRMAGFAMPRGPNFHSRALSNLLRFALHWRFAASKENQGDSGSVHHAAF